MLALVLASGCLGSHAPTSDDAGSARRSADASDRIDATADAYPFDADDLTVDASPGAIDAGVSDGATEPLDAATCVPGLGDVDGDGDGIVDRCDVCPDISDPRQLDVDGDGRGWECDPFEELGLVAESMPIAEYREGTFALAVDDSVFTVSANGALVVGRCDGSDPALLRCDGRPNQIQVQSSMVWISGGVAGDYVSLRVDDDFVDQPFDPFVDPLPTSLTLVEDGLVWTAAEHLYFAPRRSPRVDLGSFPSARLGGGTVGVYLIPESGILYWAQSGSVTPVLRGTEPFVPLRAFGGWTEGNFFWDAGTLRWYRVSGAAAVEELDTGFPMERAACPVFRSTSSANADSLAMTQGCVVSDESLGVMLITDPTHTLRARTERIGAQPTVIWAERGAFVEWAGIGGRTYEYVDLSAWTATPLIPDRMSGVHAVRGDRLAALGTLLDGRARLLVADGPVVVTNADVPGDGALQLVVGSDLVVTRRGGSIQAWSHHVAEPITIETAAFELVGTAHFDSVLVSVRTAEGATTRAIRVVDGHFLVTAMPTIARHSTSRLELLAGTGHEWIQVDEGADAPCVTRLARAASGELVVAETLPGSVLATVRETPGVLLATVRDGSRAALARLGGSLEVLWRGRDVQLRRVGTDRIFPVLDDGTTQHVCSVSDPSSVACWMLPAGVGLDPPIHHHSDSDVTFVALSYDALGNVALVRTIGEPDLTHLP